MYEGKRVESFCVQKEQRSELLNIECVQVGLIEYVVVGEGL